jgi:hypothetical protein
MGPAAASGAQPLDDAADDGLFYLSVGPLVAILLAMLLVPLRGFTTASNFTFLFLALTIVVAEFGGRGAAVATALSSALSLDFFLTQPYLRLSIDDKHDVIAFVGLAACGLIAAALGAPRRAGQRRLQRARGHLALLRDALQQLDRSEPLAERLAALLKAFGAALPGVALAVRDTRDAVLASSGQAAEARPVPLQILRLDASAAPGSRRSLRLPEEGARLPLLGRNRQLGWLDLWGSDRLAGAEVHGLLSDLARLVVLLLEGPARSSGRLLGEDVSRG